MTEPSPAYAQSLAESTAQHAASKTFSGRFLRPHKPLLIDLANRLGIASVLDFGSGKGAQWDWIDPTDGRTIAQAMGAAVTCYDPAYPPFAAEPEGVFDLVICSHTLAWIPINDHPWVLEKLFGHAAKAVFIAEKIGRRKKRFLSDPAAHPGDDWTVIDWIDDIEPVRRRFPDIETHLSVRYESGAGGRYTGRFVL